MAAVSPGYRIEIVQVSFRKWTVSAARLEVLQGRLKGGRTFNVVGTSTSNDGGSRAILPDGNRGPWSWGANGCGDSLARAGE